MTQAYSDKVNDLNDLLVMTCYSHIRPEVVIDSRKIAKRLKNPAFKRKVRTIVVDEAHLVIDW